ncbi:MAG TPA: ECF-type sigma factor, partial [Rhodanobacteraceae bacterium]|nr:ECF-type sigma factor [Rhodanobacteraceae bacterium]
MAETSNEDGAEPACPVPVPDPRAFDPGEFTQLLAATRRGDERAWTELVRLVYADLRRLARSHSLAAAD